MRLAPFYAPRLPSLLLGTLGHQRLRSCRYVEADGFYYVVDRLKELIKVKGFQVAPAEVR